jgi:hypothetical protein
LISVISNTTCDILKNIFFALIFLIPSCLFAQDPSILSASKKLEINQLLFDFGKIPQGKPVHHVFFVKNLSDKPISIDNVQASCGCTTPEWSRDSIAPGAISEIKVGYNAASIGSFEKTINVQFGKNESETISIRGFVWQNPEFHAPLNKSIANLKRNKN